MLKNNIKDFKRKINDILYFSLFTIIIFQMMILQLIEIDEMYIYLMICPIIYLIK